MSDFFDKLRAQATDPTLSEKQQGIAIGQMRQMQFQSDKYNQEHNPAKYHADKAQRAEALAKYHDEQAKSGKKSKSK